MLCINLSAFVRHSLNGYRVIIASNLLSPLEDSINTGRFKRKKVKSDHRSKFSNLSNWKEEAWKKIRASTGFEPVNSAIPVRCSTNWAMKPHIGSEVNLLTSYLPVEALIFFQASSFQLLILENLLRHRQFYLPVWRLRPSKTTIRQWVQ